MGTDLNQWKPRVHKWCNCARCNCQQFRRQSGHHRTLTMVYANAYVAAHTPGTVPPATAGECTSPSNNSGGAVGSVVRWAFGWDTKGMKAEDKAYTDKHYVGTDCMWHLKPYTPVA